MVIKIDVDGVIRDIISAMCKIYNEKFDDCLCIDDIDDYDVNTNFPKIIEETGCKPTEYFFTVHADKIFKTVSKPFDGVKEGIDLLRKYGHKIVIVTWQFNLNNIKRTLDFLDMYGINYDDICFTKDKWMVYGDYLIDDNPEFIMDKRDKSKKIIIDTSYNKDVSKRVKRVKSLYDAVEYILKITNSKKEAA